VSCTLPVSSHFNQADHSGVLNFDARNLDSADRDRQRQPLEERKVDMDIEGFRMRLAAESRSI